MKKLLLFFTITALSLIVCNAQTKDQKISNKTKFGVFGQVGHYQANDGFLGGLMPKDYFKNRYSLGMSVQRKLSSKFTFWTGLALTHKRYEPGGQWIEDTTYPGYTHVEGAWNCTPLLQTPQYSHLNTLALDIPIMVQYYPFNNIFFISSGLELNVGIYEDYKSAFKSYDGTITQINHSVWGKGFNLMLPLGMGVSLPIGKQKQIGIEPGIKAVAFSHHSGDDYIGLYTLRVFFYF